MFWGIVSAVLVLIISFLVLKYMQLAKVIMVVEDELSETVEALEQVEQSLEGFLLLKLYFDNQELQAVVAEAKSDVTMAKVSVTKMIERFVQFSKQKYVVEEDVDPDEVQQALKTIARHKKRTKRITEDDLERLTERWK